MGYYKWRYAYVAFTSATRHYVLAAVIKSATLEKAREDLDKKVKSYLGRHPEVEEHHRNLNREVIPKSWVRTGGLRRLIRDVKSFSLDEI
ncbi:MAG: hypothetical protein AABX11_02230 [Nanoarchaeota archaeon]